MHAARIFVRRLTVLFACFAVALGAQLAGATGRRVSLTPEQRALFFSGGQAVAGLTQAQLVAALSAPAAIGGIPVLAIPRLGNPFRVGPVGNVLDPVEGAGAPIRRKVTPLSEGLLSSKISPIYPANDAGGGGGGPSCGGTIRAGIEYYNVYKARLASFYVEKWWDCTGSSISSAPSARVIPDVTQNGSSYGWQYDGTDQKFDEFYKWGGVSDGGHESYAVGRFHANSGPWGYESATPNIDIKVHYDGTFEVSGQG